MARKRKKPSPPVSETPKPPPKVATKLGALLTQAGVSPAALAAAKAAAQKAEKAARASARASAVASPRGPATLPPPAPAAPLRVPEPEAPRNATELRIMNDAYAGVRPLAQKSQRLRAPLGPAARAPTSPEDLSREARSSDAEARARLDALVGGGTRFATRIDDDFVEALREGASPKLLGRVSGKGFAPEATLDLHGVRAADAATLVTRFVRQHRRAGARHLLIVTGKGLHADGGVSTLRKVALSALTQGGAAPLVLAVATAHASHGGSGALSVLLE